MPETEWPGGRTIVGYSTRGHPPRLVIELSDGTSIEPSLDHPGAFVIVYDTERHYIDAREKYRASDRSEERMPDHS